MRHRTISECHRRRRRGVATLDYILVMGVILPLAGMLFVVVTRIVQLVYEMIVVTGGSPLM